MKEKRWLMREAFYILIGLFGAALAYALGGWDTALQTLVSFMFIEIITGFIVAKVYKKIPLSDALSKALSFKVLMRKCMMLAMVYMGVRLDRTMYWDFVRLSVIIAFIANELVSIIQNAKCMGIKPPGVLQKVLVLLERKGNDDKPDEVQNVQEVHKVSPPASEPEAKNDETEKKEG
jgi:toxin secretion/phage lysis holin